MADLAAYRVVSLLAMLEFQAAHFVDLMRDLNDFAWNMRQAMGEMNPELASAPWNLTAGLKTILHQRLAAVEQHSSALGLDAAATLANRLRARLDRTDLPGPSLSELNTSFSELRSRIEDQLQGKLFMHVPSDKAAYWQAAQLLGEQVAVRFSTVAEDVAEAGKCFACDRFTACVFHLMRVMEVGVQRVAKKLGLVAIDLNRPWGNILTDINNAIAALPGARHGAAAKDKVKYRKFAEVAAYLKHVKDAWRNETMHPKRTYTPEEAETLFRNVRSFTQAIVRLR